MPTECQGAHAHGLTDEDTSIYDVIQIGYGPVGQGMASLLGHSSHSVAVFERWPELYGLPRAGHVDDEVMRVFQSIGAADAIELKAWPMTSYDVLDAKGAVLLSFDWNHQGATGWHRDYLFYQPYLEEVLDRRARSFGSVNINLGWEAVSVEQYADRVDVGLREVAMTADGGLDPTGRTRTVGGRFLIGADGANSFVRESFGIPRIDLGFEADWLVMDVRPHDPGMTIVDARLGREVTTATQICDPSRPIYVSRWLGREHARWEFMLLPGEAAADMERRDVCWDLLARWGLDANNANLLRSKVYTFRSLVADSWRDGRVLLIGDAAHLMPPFMGQGMCAGIRDAKTLAWKLDLVLAGNADQALLDTYEQERRPHVEAAIDMSVALGKVVCTTDPEEAALRDAAFREDNADPPPPLPGLGNGVLQRDPAGAIVPPAGEFSIQARITHEGQTGRFDDVVGRGWIVLSAADDPRPGLSSEQQGFLEQIGTHFVWFGHADGAAADLEGRYAVWFGELGAAALIVRPDFYLFGAAPALGDLPRLIDDLHDQIRQPRAAPRAA